MNNTSLDIKVVYGIINLQRIFRMKSQTIKDLNRRVILFNEILISMANNITNNYNNKIYVNKIATYKKTMEKLEDVKQELMKIKTPITIKSSNDFEKFIDKLSLKLFILMICIQNYLNLLFLKI